MALVDRFNRIIDYIRISVTDRCDFRCVYCMSEEMAFLPKSHVLTLEEIEIVVKAFVSLGVNKVRLTGGEPLVRRNVESLLHKLGALEGLDHLLMTTNGSQLPRLAPDLAEAGVKRINISIDSLDADKFKQLTRTGELRQVLAGIQATKDAGIKRIKLNSVILKNRNDDEIIDLVNFAREQQVDISFIEEMPLGIISEHDRAECFMPSDDIRAVISERYPLIPSSDKTGGPSVYYTMADSDTKIGFISPHSHNFCGDCNRVRITVEGRLLLCLGNEHSLDLKTIVRATHANEEAKIAELKAEIIHAMDLKPERHHFDLSDDEPQILRFMNTTGG